ncbi:MAG TPA: Clp protease N-terminal domain-containing protein [Candidatus Dormibacteraeota bacterium]|nr:Clp protease N-terminal domain-containing protein [Candidatus Dormibacteraeota bacterium]
MNRVFGAHGVAPLLVSWEIGSSVARQFEIEAKLDGAKFIEAEHMLLALAANADTDAGRLLIESGLDHERLSSALREERRRTLAFAGMSAPDKKLVEATGLDSSLSLGTSAKAAVRRALIGSRHERRRRGRLRGSDLLAGILEAEFGTVPRALAIAGVDRSALISRAWGSE